MKIIAFFQEAYLIKDILKSQGIPDFQAQPLIPKLIDPQETIDEILSYDSFEPPVVSNVEPTPDDF